MAARNIPGGLFLCLRNGNLRAVTENDELDGEVGTWNLEGVYAQGARGRLAQIMDH
jgi:hypothetical protein